MVNGIGHRLVDFASHDALSHVWEILSTVMDPEIPSLSVVDLGMITDVAVSNGAVRVKLLPTFVACPATSYIRNSISSTLEQHGIQNTNVEMETELSWSSDRLTEQGRRRLADFGLGVPIKIEGVLDYEAIERVSCPHCGSNRTELRSMFGSTLCRSMHYCHDCKQGFERFKPV